ncbi:hypothetical protein BGZ96_007012 [Linnemannia gamsii]|uniref:Uncharacterized protein n=1 Tax=Linnemannia gamsii TaxID=64522 RepID=A0ABQ7K1Q7_9FUNG|nr:hypothetical protein BGZ96_007012 [Linnemannia gamsii]
MKIKISVLLAFAAVIAAVVADPIDATAAASEEPFELSDFIGTHAAPSKRSDAVAATIEAAALIFAPQEPVADEAHLIETRNDDSEVEASNVLDKRAVCPNGYGSCKGQGNKCCQLGGGCCKVGCCKKGYWCYAKLCCPNSSNGCDNKSCCPKGAQCCRGGGCCKKGYNCWRTASGRRGCCPKGKNCG